MQFYYVYILLSFKDRKFYVGYTNNLKRRYNEHQQGLVMATKNHRPLKLVYCEAYINEKNAREREIFYKGGRGREVFHNILQITLETIEL